MCTFDIPFVVSSFCSFSETTYGDQLYHIKDTLSRLFHLSVDMAINFGNLQSRLAFDSLQQEDLKILTEGKY